MSYLVGSFSRYSVDNPLSEVSVVKEITRDHLINAKRDDDFQVINLVDLTYFNPENNQWVKINQKP